jgi:hypothetical protein
VNVELIVYNAIEMDLPDLLDGLYHNQEKFPLNQEDFTLAAKKGSRHVLEWACTTDPTLKLDKHVILGAMEHGNVDVLKLLNQYDTYIPSVDDGIRTENHLYPLELIINFYNAYGDELDLETTCSIAINLERYTTVIWVYQRWLVSKSTDITVDHLDLAVKRREWSVALWIMEKNAQLPIPRKESILHTKRISYVYRPWELEKRARFLNFLSYLYEQTNDEYYLPTVGDLDGQPVKYVEEACGRCPHHLSCDDLIKLCKRRAESTDLYVFVSKLGLKVDTAEMAEAALQVRNIEVLDWFLRTNPSKLPSNVAFQTALSPDGPIQKSKLLDWVFEKLPHLLPEWESLSTWVLYSVEVCEAKVCKLGEEFYKEQRKKGLEKEAQACWCTIC